MIMLNSFTNLFDVSIYFWYAGTTEAVIISDLFPSLFNPFALSEPYMGRTAQLTSRRYILNTYSTNIHTEYFKRAA
jgi:hypothetical protein